MKQAIIIAKPPVYDQCVAAFGADNIVGRPILWSWEDSIYNPMDVDIPPELRAHEMVHGERQSVQGAKVWWAQYLADKNFRFEEERLAHRAEWREYLRRHAGRNNQFVLDMITTRLASALYGHMVSLDGARFAILARQ
jgi:hypothetical protein